MTCPAALTSGALTLLLCADPAPDDVERVRTTLVAALQDGAAAFPAGRVAYRSREVHTGRGAEPRRSSTLSEGTLVWDGDDARWETRSEDREEEPGTFGYPNPPPLAEERPVPADRPLHVRIRTGKEQILSAPSERWAVRRPVGGAPLPLIDGVRPVDCWTGRPEEYARLPWAEELANLQFLPEGEGDTPPRDVSVRGDLVEVTAGARRNGRPPRAGLTLRVRLDRPARVLLCRHGSASGGYLEEYTSEWAAAPAAPTSVRYHTRYTTEDGDSYEMQFDVLFESYEPNPDVPADAFRLSSLKLPPGSRIKVQDRRGRLVRTERVAGRETPPDRFKELAEELRAGAFAGGKGGAE